MVNVWRGGRERDLGWRLLHAGPSGVLSGAVGMSGTQEVDDLGQSPGDVGVADFSLRIPDWKSQFAEFLGENCRSPFWSIGNVGASRG